MTTWGQDLSRLTLKERAVVGEARRPMLYYGLASATQIDLFASRQSGYDLSSCKNDRAANMTRLAFLILIPLIFRLPAIDPLSARIGHTDPSNYKRSRSHNSAGDIACQLLVPPS